MIDGLNMEEKQILLDHIDQIHTTKMGIDRIKRNLKLDNMDVDEDVVEYCKKMILSEKCMIFKQGKNWYCEINVNNLNIILPTNHNILCF